MFLKGFFSKKETKRLSKNFKDQIEKSHNLKFFWPRSKIGAPISLASPMKQFLQRFESNQNKSKQMKINDVFYRFTSKPYSAAILGKNFHLYQLKVPK